MTVASFLLLGLALLGAFDIAYFHAWTCKLTKRPESRREAWIHVVRGVVYALQLALVPNVVFAGRFYALFVALFVVDIAVAFTDILEEPRSRASQGGLPRGEYLTHIILTLMVGAMLREVVVHSLPWASRADAIAWSPSAPTWLRAVLGVLSLGSLGVAAKEALELLAAAPPRPLHVAVHLRAPLARVWAVTQDPERHPSWDHRFSRITMIDEPCRTGARMLYEKRILGVTIRGVGRYKLCRPMRQSTFEFGSDDPRSIIRRGVGLWLYEATPEGTLFRTSYTYEVRWGRLGRVIDRFLFRPLFQRETERSFRRLAEEHFGERCEVGGARGRKPVVPAHFARALEAA